MQQEYFQQSPDNINLIGVVTGVLIRVVYCGPFLIHVRVVIEVVC